MKYLLPIVVTCCSATSLYVASDLLDENTTQNTSNSNTTEVNKKGDIKKDTIVATQSKKGELPQKVIEKKHPFNNPLYVDATKLQPYEKSQLFEDKDGKVYSKSVIIPKDNEPKKYFQVVEQAGTTDDLNISAQHNVMVVSKDKEPKMVEETKVESGSEEILPKGIEEPKSKKKTVQKSNIVPKGTIISNESLERAMLLTNDLAGVKVVGVTAIPGAKVGTSNFAIKTETSSLYDGYIIGDNYGSRYTGKNRVMAGMSFNSLAGIGDKLSISGLISNGNDLKNGRVGYLVPLMPNGLTGEVGYSQTAYSLTDQYESLDAIGDSRTIDATLTYPIIRTRLETLKISSTLAVKDMTDEKLGARDSDKDITSLNVALTHSKNQKLFGVDAVVNSNLTLTTGKLEEVINNVSQRYNKLNGYINSSLTLSNEFSLSTNLSFQKDLSSKNLDGSEDMSIGGSNGVKVFPDGELSAENGLLLNLELFKTLPSYSKLSHKLGFFYDIGRATMEDSSTDITFEKRTLQDAGIGYYASYNSFFAKAQLARVVGGQQIETENVGNTTRFLVQGGWSF